MEEISHEIEKMVQAKESLYKSLLELLETERQYIVDMDVESLWKCAEEKKQISLEIVGVRNEILALAESVCGEAGMDAQTFSLARLLKAVPFPSSAKARLKLHKVTIELCKEEIAARSRDNQKHVREYLAVIDDIMAVAVNDPSNAQYTPMGAMPGQKQSSRLIHAEV